MKINYDTSNMNKLIKGELGDVIISTSGESDFIYLIINLEEFDDSFKYALLNLKTFKIDGTYASLDMITEYQYINEFEQIKHIVKADKTNLDLLL